MSQRCIGVIGLGRFGEQLTAALADAGASVIAFDLSQTVVARVDAIRGVKGERLQRKGHFREQLERHVPSDWDVAVVAIGEDFEQQQNCVLALKEMGVTCIYGRAQSEGHAEILKRVGGDTVTVMSPEKEYANGLAKSLARSGIQRVLELSSEHEVVTAPIPASMVGSTLKELGVGAHHGVLVIGVTRGGALLEQKGGPAEKGDIIIPAQAETELRQDDTFTLVGEPESINEFLQFRPKS